MRQVALVALVTLLFALPPIPLVAANDDCTFGCVVIPGPTATYYLDGNTRGCPHNGPSSCRAIGLLWQETNKVSGLQTTGEFLWQPDTLVIL